ncbi:outer membrane autotransporter protein [Kaistia hirudinis]|uniref:Outer membrane autotransporter protein n=1 Tax=Kaistia hirudinis TaxID=1293440 RepID=A0A840ARS2_9HYPH|nr:autotransporter domain-containing protein [Kaistia hirudinis]MBB3933080.1 outer membrane autotransporter protein [Kaistia hirudinis]
MAAGSLMLTGGSALAACTVTGTTTLVQCDSSVVGVSMVPGVGSLTVRDVDTVFVGYGSPLTSGTYDQTVWLTGNTVVNNPNYSALVMQFGTDQSANVIPVTVNVDVTIDSAVRATAAAGFGTIWIRNDYAGNISINNAGTIDWQGPTSYPGNAAIDGATNLGAVTIVNSGTVTSNARGIYADGNSRGVTDGEEQTVSVTNTATGHVTATTAGIRVIDYYGLAEIVNEGTVEATLQHALIAWSANGDATINNSGTAISGNDNAIFAATETGDASVYNSGTVVAEGDPALDAAHNALKAAQGYNGLRAAVDTAGDVEIANGATGSVTANRDAGIRAETPKGDITIVNNGTVTGRIGISADSGFVSGYTSASVARTDGAISITNIGRVSATDLAVWMDATTNSLVNTGTLASSGPTTVATGDGNSTVVNSGTISAGSANGVAVAMGAGSNRFVMSDTSNLVGKVTNASTGNMLELTGAGSGTLNLGDVSDTGTYEGFTNLTKSGSGLWVLTGSGGSLTGTTTINAGALQLAQGASSASVFTVDGGVLSGSGSIGGLVVNAGGTVSPGYSPGTLTVNGDVAFAAGSTYVVDVAASGAHDLIAASGTASLTGGTVQVNAAPGANPFTTYAILSAVGGVSGTFDSATTNYAFLDPLLSYDANDVYLKLMRNAVAFTALAGTANQKASAFGTESLGLGNPVYDAVLTLTAAQAPGAFDALSGEAYASATSIIAQDSIYLRQAVTGRVWQSLDTKGVGGPNAAALGAATGLAVWGQGYGAWGDIDSDGNAASVSRDTGGFFAGVDGAVADGVRLGVLGGYGRSTFEIDDRASSGDIDTYSLGGYGGARIGAIGLLGAASYSWNDTSIGRTVAFPGYVGANNASYQLGTTQLFGEANWHFDLSPPGAETAYGKAWLEPFVAPAYVNLGSADVTESGSSSALTGTTGGEDLFYVTLGARAATMIKLENEASIVPRIMLAWQHAFDDVDPTAQLAFVGGGLPFSVAGVPIAEDTAVVNAGVDYNFNSKVSAGLTYSGQFGDGLQDNAVKGNLDIKF